MKSPFFSIYFYFQLKTFSQRFLVVAEHFGIMIFQAIPQVFQVTRKWLQKVIDAKR